MRVLLALIIGIGIGAGGHWYYSTHQSSPEVQAVKERIDGATRSAREAGQAMADAAADIRITAAIKSKLVASSELSAFNISVSTTGGVVTLSGTVPSSDAIGKAVRLAMETDGVREVVSSLRVKARPL
jgi:hyperosmotically inducible periplasmic protein